MKLKSKFLGEKARYITGAVLLLLAIVVLSLNSMWVFWAVLGIAYLIGGHEALQIYQKIYGSTPSVWHYVGLIFVWFLVYLTPPVESVFFVGMFIIGYLAYRALDVSHALVFLYPTLPFVYILALFKGFGVMAVVWLVVVVVSTDVGAYFGGRLFGNTPLSPSSPKKTFEGAFIGFMLASVVGGLVGLKYMGFLYAFVASAIMAISAIWGDLYESSLKRRANIKDSGNILPGHGGVLDRLDAMFFAAVSLHFLLRTKATLEVSL
ncbi:Phosphatidate cytidylyltransferase CdsA [Helicobacter sp. NHP19-012]|uniref:Phosphatidate cytidylyltransferase n=1 Tax=Helicobacter gastrofelis TaxID=2849642 RepID=A0ABM7SCV6_9HELI|nr:phosphatidate cytidylyltransferase [Helicobacter sp. NHP19-012]BCZ18546.1 Phosphatidate cytidylyltransferase CdsA [Helicobacter sp. NHP19-012]